MRSSANSITDFRTFVISSGNSIRSTKKNNEDIYCLQALFKRLDNYESFGFTIHGWVSENADEEVLSIPPRYPAAQANWARIGVDREST